MSLKDFLKTPHLPATTEVHLETHRANTIFDGDLSEDQLKDLTNAGWNYRKDDNIYTFYKNIPAEYMVEYSALKKQHDEIEEVVLKAPHKKIVTRHFYYGLYYFMAQVKNNTELRVYIQNDKFCLQHNSFNFIKPYEGLLFWESQGDCVKFNYLTEDPSFGNFADSIALGMGMSISNERKKNKKSLS